MSAMTLDPEATGVFEPLTLPQWSEVKGFRFDATRLGLVDAGHMNLHATMGFLREGFAAPFAAIVRNVIISFGADQFAAASECYCSPGEFALPLGTARALLRESPSIDRYAIVRPQPFGNNGVPDRLLYSYCTKTIGGFQQADFSETFISGKPSLVQPVMYGLLGNKHFVNLFNLVGPQLAADDFTRLSMVLR